MLQVMMGEQPAEQGEDEVRKYDPLGSMLSSRFDTWRTAREPIVAEWLSDLRAYNGQYDQDMVFAKGRSKVFVRLTRMKTDAAYARIVDIEFGQSEPNWAVDPTPKPTLSDEQFRQVITEMSSVLGRVPEEDEFDKAVMQEASAASEKMTSAIEDQLAEGGYEREMKTALRELVIFGTACMQGPTIKIQRQKKWVKGEAWKQEENEVLSPKFQSVSILDLFPDPYAVDTDDCVGMFQRHVLTRDQFRALGDRPQFKVDVIAEVIRESPDGNHQPLSHETAIYQTGTQGTSTSNRFDILEYWGMVSGLDLASCGCEVEDEDAEYQCNVWSSGGRVIRVAMDVPKVSEVFHFGRYKPVPHQFWGEGVPREMRDSQTTVNSGVRALLDNLGITALPIIELNLSLLHESQLTTATELFAGKIFLRDGGDPSAPLIRTYNIDNHTSDLVNVIELFRRFADEETSLPSYTHGEQTQSLNKTAGGMSMLMGAANVVLKAVIKNIDDMTESFISAMFAWNMRWNPDDSIKGDMKIIARGSSALMAKEIQSQRLLQFAQMTANPIDINLVDRREVLKQIAASMEIDAEKIILEQAPPQQAGGPLDPGAIIDPAMASPDGLPVTATGSLPGGAGSVAPGQVPVGAG